MNNTENARPRLKELAVLAIAATIALQLFTFGLNYPPKYRVRGDAYEYLSIAYQFDGFSSVLGYAGKRTVGFPLFEFMVRNALTMFASNTTVLQWVNAICFTLLITHIVTAWFFSVWVRRTNLIKSENGAFFLFIFLATYPALIGHTTSPLTDTLAIDLVLCAIISIEKSFNAKSIYRASLFSGIAALFFGFSILVRPGSLLGIAVALATGGVISLFSERRKMIVIGGTVLGCVVILAPFCSNCAQKYGSVCLQSPQTVNFVMSAQLGLRGARTLWGKGSLVPGGGSILPDEIMFTNYYRRCHLESIVGIDKSSLTGCLFSRPLSIPAYTIKKWIGLFDHFRFTPYLEEDTPFWLRWLSRTYDSLSWIGLALFFWSLLQASKRQNRSNIKELVTNNITPVLLVVYSVVMLAQHTVLHIEDRYGFPILPLCATMLVIYGEKSIRAYRSFGWRSIGPVAVYSVMAWALFVTQIIIWDRSPFY